MFMLFGWNLIWIAYLMDLMERRMVFCSGTWCPKLMLHPTTADRPDYEGRYTNGISWTTCYPMKPNHNHRECHIFPVSSILGHSGWPKYAGDFTQKEANQLEYVLGQNADNAVQLLQHTAERRSQDHCWVKRTFLVRHPNASHDHYN